MKRFRDNNNNKYRWSSFSSFVLLPKKLIKLRMCNLDGTCILYMSWWKGRCIYLSTISLLFFRALSLPLVCLLFCATGSFEGLTDGAQTHWDILRRADDWLYTGRYIRTHIYINKWVGRALRRLRPRLRRRRRRSRF